MNKTKWVKVLLGVECEWPRTGVLLEIILKDGHRTFAKFKEDGFFYASRKVKHMYKSISYWAYAREAPNP